MNNSKEISKKKKDLRNQIFIESKTQHFHSFKLKQFRQFSPNLLVKQGLISIITVFIYYCV